MRLIQVNTKDKQTVKQFVDFPATLYYKHQLWVPALYGDSLNTLNKEKHPFYEHSEADFFIVENKGEILGRIAVMDNRNFNTYHHSQAAFFGYFDAVNDSQVAQELFAAVQTWAKERSLTDMVGPRGITGVGGSVLVEGFEYAPALTIPYNYPYYDTLIKGAGFQKDTDLISGYMHTSHVLSDRIHRIAERVKRRRGFWVKQFESAAEIRYWIPLILEAHRQAFSTLHSYYPPTQAEVRALIDTLLAAIDTSLIRVIMKEQEIAGFLLAYPDISKGIQKANGRLFPTGWYHILQDRKQTEVINLNGLGILPQYQGLGGNTILYTEMEKLIKESRFEHVEIIQVDEQNTASVNDMESLGTIWRKRHRYYKKTL